MKKTKKLLSFLLAMTMIISVLAFPSAATDGHCDNEAECLICNVANLINALPEAEDITADNAAAVTDQIHAIDRIKFDLTDDQYDELLTLVDTGADESGQGLGVPVRYMEALETVSKLGGGGWIAVTKKFVSANGSTVDVTDAEVQIKVTNVDTKDETTLTLATLGTQTSALGVDYYTENADGWTYKYIVPAGTYYVEEVGYTGAEINGNDFVTGSVLYNGEESKGTTVTVTDGGAQVLLENLQSYSFVAQDSDGQPVSGVSISLYVDGEVVTSGVTDREGIAFNYNPGNSSLGITAKVTAVPEGYKMPEEAEYTFTWYGLPNSDTWSFESDDSTVRPKVIVTLEEKAALPVPVNFIASYTGVEWGDITYFMNTNDTTITTDQINNVYVRSINPNVALRFINIADEKDVVDGQVGTTTILSAGKTYKVTQIDEGAPSYNLPEGDLILTIDKNGTPSWDETSGINGGYIDDNNQNEDSNAQDVVWLKLTAEYVNHTYKVVWPEDTTYKMGLSIPVYVGETEVADFVVLEGVEELTFKRLKYAADGSEVNFEIKPKDFGTDRFWNKYTFSDVQTVDNVTTITLKEITYEVNFDVLEGTVAKITDEDDNVVWSSEEDINPELRIGEFYTVNYTSVPEGYGTASQTLYINDNADLTYNDEIVLEKLYDYSKVPTVTLSPGVEIIEPAVPVEYTVDAIHYGTEYDEVPEYLTGVTAVFSAYGEDDQTVIIDDGTDAVVKLKAGVDYTVTYTNVPEGFDINCESTFTIYSEDGYADYSYCYVDTNAETVTLMLKKALPEGNASVTIKYYDEDNRPLKVSAYAEYVITNADGANLYLIDLENSNVTGVSEYTWTDLADGLWYFNVTDCENPMYQKGSDVRLTLKDGKIVNDHYSEYYFRSCEEISCDPETGIIEVMLYKNRISGEANVYTDDGTYLDYLTSYEIKDSEGNIVASDELDDASDSVGYGSVLEDGTYYIYFTGNDSWNAYIDIPTKGFEFVVENYHISEDSLEVSGLDNYSHDYGEAVSIDITADTSKTFTITAKLNPSEGESMPENTTVQLWRYNYYTEEDVVIGESKAVEVNSESQTFTWENTPAFVKVEDDYGELVWDKADYYVTYTVADSNKYYFENDGSNIYFEATVGESSDDGDDEEEVKYYIDLSGDFENGKVEADAEEAAAGEYVILTAIPAAGYELTKLTVTNDETGEAVYEYSKEEIALMALNSDHEFEMPASDVTVDATFSYTGKYYVTLASNLNGGTASADYTVAEEGTTITVTVTPDDGCQVDVFAVTADTTGESVEFTKVDDTTYTFTMPKDDVHVGIAFGEAPEAPFETHFTVTATVGNIDADVDTADEGMDVYANDTVVIEVTVNGDAFTNADWTLLYDSSKFELTDEVLHDKAVKVTTGSNLLGGKLVAPVGDTYSDEYADGTVVATYTFTALSQTKEVTGRFAITTAHANDYEMAGDMDNCPANVDGVDVTILLVDDEAQLQKPSGTIEAKEVTYNGLLQTGNEFVLDEEFKDATVTYFAYTDGSEIEDADGDGAITSADVGGLAFRTTLPAWQNVGTYNYYVKITGDGLAETIVSTTLTINPKPVTATVIFAVDPDVNEVELTPVIEGVYDETYKGTVTVTFNGQDYEFAASEFVYDGESSAVANRSVTVSVPTSGEFTATVKYVSGTDADADVIDNYDDGEGEATVDVDKISASTDTADALEDALTSEFTYDGTDHSVVIDTSAINAIAETPDGAWVAGTPVDAYDGTENPTVKNVGDEKLVKIVFTDANDIYNDITVYVVLKVTPAKVTITVENKSKPVGAEDPELTGVITGLVTGEEDILNVKYVREPGETVGTYNITASYVPNDNYVVTVVDADFVIGAPDMDGDDADVKIEVVDLSCGGTNGDVTPDYIADAEGGNAKRLILIYTDIDKAYFTYEGENFFDVTAAGYKYVDNNYDAKTFEEDANAYKHVYGLVVDAIGTYAATEEYEKQYKDKVIFVGSDAQYAPEDIIYDADINMSVTEVDVNDYSMTNGIYNAMYDRVAYMKSILKADTDHDKMVDTDDAYAIKANVEAKN